MKLWQKPMDWKSVSRMSTFTPTVNVLSKISDFELDWDAISKNKFLSKDVLWPYRNKLNWQYISQSETFQILGFEFFCKYREYLDWTIISNSTAFTLSIKNLREFKDEIDWEIIGQRKDLKYTNILLDCPIRQYYVLVDRHFKEKKQVQDYADILCRSPKTFSNLFSACGLPSPLRVIHDRIEAEAMRLLLYTHKSAKEISSILGFEDLSASAVFSRK